MLKEWLFSDGAASSNKESNVSSRQFIDGSTTFEPLTGRKLHITVMEGQNLLATEKSGKCDPYVKLQYGKVGVLHFILGPTIIQNCSNENDFSILCGRSR